MRALSYAFLLCGLLASCEPARPAEPALGQGTLRAPPKVGSSITHTQMCECQTCDPSECCSGDWGERSASTAECKDSYDFTREGCGLTVSSCTSRCTRHIWRVKLSEDCAATTPLVCCNG